MQPLCEAFPNPFPCMCGDLFKSKANGLPSQYARECVCVAYERLLALVATVFAIGVTIAVVMSTRSTAIQVIKI